LEGNSANTRLSEGGEKRGRRQHREEVDKATPDYLRGERSEEGGNTERRWLRQHQII
jgi:hypothetical protein